MKLWNVRTDGANPSYLGQVIEDSEELARCAALCKFGLPDDEDHDSARRGIRLEDEFMVVPA